MINIWRGVFDKGWERLCSFDAATAIFAAIAMGGGIFFVISTPLLWGPDETSHVGRVYQISHGTFIAQEIRDPDSYSKYGFGGHVPITLKEVMNYVSRDFNVNGHQDVYGVKYVDSPGDYQRFSNYSLQAPLVAYNFSNTAIYSPVSYLPAALAFGLSAKTDLSLGPTIYLARVFGLIFFVLIVAMAIYSLRGFRIQWLFLALSLIPTYIYQASVISADTMTNALAFALVALTVKALLCRQGLTRLETTLLIVCVCLLPIVKPTYIFAIMLVFVIPLKRLALPKYARWIVLGAVGCGLLMYGIWQLNTIQLANANKWIIAGVVPWWQGINTTEQAQYILGHPLDFLKTFFRTNLIYDNRYLNGLFGDLAFHHVVVPGLSQVLAASSVAIAVLASERIRSSRRQIFILGAAVAMSVFAIYGVFYMTISHVGQLTIEGVQGRYFMPILPMIITLIVCLIGIRIEKNNQKYVPHAIVIMSLTGLLLASAKYYYVTWG